MHCPSDGSPSCHMWKWATSIRRPSKTSRNGASPFAPTTVADAGISIISSRRRSAAIASPSRVCAFSLTSSLARAASSSSRLVTGGTAETASRSVGRWRTISRELTGGAEIQ